MGGIKEQAVSFTLRLTTDVAITATRRVLARTRIVPALAALSLVLAGGVAFAGTLATTERGLAPMRAAATSSPVPLASPSTAQAG